MSKDKRTTSVTIAISQMIDVIKLNVANTLVEKSRDLDLDRKKIQKLNVPTKKLRDPNISKKLKKAFE